MDAPPPIKAALMFNVGTSGERSTPLNITGATLTKVGPAGRTTEPELANVSEFVAVLVALFESWTWVLLRIAVTVVLAAIPLPVTTVPTVNPLVEGSVTTLLPLVVVPDMIPVEMVETDPKLDEVALIAPLSVRLPAPTSN